MALFFYSHISPKKNRLSMGRKAGFGKKHTQI